MMPRTQATERDKRKKALRAIVRAGQMRTQQDLARALQADGFTVGQATLSRDIAELDLRKLNGTYILSEDMRLADMVQNAVKAVRDVNNMLVVNTASGMAQGVAAAIDGAALKGVLGTIAGDDTILMICEDDNVAKATGKELSWQMTK
ncbi:MAG: ArgR family transcriptional regulator [Coriobacteriales bacterium]|jgi:transcriptional regulator of arginine metabolism|nr:ArgR family transcriptional regulator [Coriobacteriales bacterium]